MKPRSSRTTATQHPIGSALVMRAFSGARSLKAFGAYNFAGDVGKVLLPATATSLLLILPWRPAYTMLGLAGIVAAMVIAIVTPKVAPEPHPPSAEIALGERGEGDTARRFGCKAQLSAEITVTVRRSRRSAANRRLLRNKQQSGVV
jgi:MFS family permease